jgi:hypothetical protein
LADGEPAARLKGKLTELEPRRLELESELETVKAPAPRLRPNVAEVSRRKVEELHNALGQNDCGPARELVRGLVEAIVLIPENGRLRVEVRGELASILRLSGLAKKKLRLWGRSFCRANKDGRGGPQPPRVDTQLPNLMVGSWALCGRSGALAGLIMSTPIGQAERPCSIRLLFLLRSLAFPQALDDALILGVEGRIVGAVGPA